MSAFDSFSENPDFVKLNSKRDAVLFELVSLKESIEALDKEKPTLRAFQRLEGKIDENIADLEAANKTVAAWFSKNGGDVLNDTGYKSYRVKAVKIINEVELAREAYHELLDSKGLLKPEPAATPELLDILKTLSDAQKVSTETQRSALDTQNKALEAQKSANKK